MAISWGDPNADPLSRSKLWTALGNACCPNPIPEVRLFEELLIAIKAVQEQGRNVNLDTDDISDAFEWAMTPQTEDFWGACHDVWTAKNGR